MTPRERIASTSTKVIAQITNEILGPRNRIVGEAGIVPDDFVTSYVGGNNSVPQQPATAGHEDPPLSHVASRPAGSVKSLRRDSMP